MLVWTLHPHSSIHHEGRGGVGVLDGRTTVFPGRLQGPG